jgi:hypothetical protein
MTVLKAYDEGTEQWQTIVVGRQGPAPGRAGRPATIKHRRALD